MVKILNLVEASLLSSYLEVLIAITGSGSKTFIEEVIKSCFYSFAEVAQNQDTFMIHILTNLAQ